METSFKNLVPLVSECWQYCARSGIQPCSQRAAVQSGEGQQGVS
jgi:hypothetical protein